MGHADASGYPTDSVLAFEIARQPEAWLSTLKLVASAPVSRNFEDIPVILTGAGTSAYAGIAIAAAWPGARAIATTDLLLQAREEIELALPGLSQRGLLISLARSGDSPESAAVVRRFQKLFPYVRHLAIVCNPEGRLARTPGVEVICLDPTTNDRSLAMTGSFSNLTLAGLCLMHHDAIAGELQTISGRLRERLGEMYAIAEQVASSATDRLVVLSSSMHGLSVEASLKVVELTAGGVLGIAETFLGFRHGPASVLRRDTPVVCFTSTNPAKRHYERDLVEDLKSRGLGRLVVIGDDSTADWPADIFVHAVAPTLPDALRTPFEVPLAQLVAYHCSLRAGMDPDYPSPEGTVTRVVRPFAIHEEG